MKATSAGAEPEAGSSTSASTTSAPPPPPAPDTAQQHAAAAKEADELWGRLTDGEREKLAAWLEDLVDLPADEQQRHLREAIEDVKLAKSLADFENDPRNWQNTLGRPGPVEALFKQLLLQAGPPTRDRPALYPSYGRMVFFEQRPGQPQAIFTKFASDAHDAVRLVALELTPNLSHQHILDIIYRHEEDFAVRHMRLILGASYEQARQNAALLKAAVRRVRELGGDLHLFFTSELDDRATDHPKIRVALDHVRGVGSIGLMSANANNRGMGHEAAWADDPSEAPKSHEFVMQTFYDARDETSDFWSQLAVITDGFVLRRSSGSLIMPTDALFELWLTRLDPRDNFDEEEYRAQQVVNRSHTASTARKEAKERQTGKSAREALRLRRERIAFASAGTADEAVHQAAKNPTVPAPPEATVVLSAEEKERALKARDALQAKVDEVRAENPQDEEALKEIRARQKEIRKEVEKAIPLPEPPEKTEKPNSSLNANYRPAAVKAILNRRAAEEAEISKDEKMEDEPVHNDQGAGPAAVEGGVIVDDQAPSEAGVDTPCADEPGAAALGAPQMGDSTATGEKATAEWATTSDNATPYPIAPKSVPRQSIEAVHDERSASGLVSGDGSSPGQDEAKADLSLKTNLRDRGLQDGEPQHDGTEPPVNAPSLMKRPAEGSAAEGDAPPARKKPRTSLRDHPSDKSASPSKTPIRSPVDVVKGWRRLIQKVLLKPGPLDKQSEGTLSKLFEEMMTVAVELDWLQEAKLVKVLKQVEQQKFARCAGFAARASELIVKWQNYFSSSDNSNGGRTTTATGPGGESKLDAHHLEETSQRPGATATASPIVSKSASQEAPGPADATSSALVPPQVPDSSGSTAPVLDNHDTGTDSPTTPESSVPRKLGESAFIRDPSDSDLTDLDDDLPFKPRIVESDEDEDGETGIGFVEPDDEDDVGASGSDTGESAGPDDEGGESDAGVGHGEGSAPAASNESGDNASKSSGRRKSIGHRKIEKTHLSVRRNYSRTAAPNNYFESWEDDIILREVAKPNPPTYAGISKLLKPGRTRRDAYQRHQRLLLLHDRDRRDFTAEDDATIKRLRRQGWGWTAIARKLERMASSVQRRAEANLGLA
ncbi:hypothetical protein JCM10296v2_002045 [Rhodotorula toruloides]